VGLLRLRMIRPWPTDAIRDALRGRRAVAVLRSESGSGAGRYLFQEIAACLYDEAIRPRALCSFIGAWEERISRKASSGRSSSRRRRPESGKGIGPVLLSQKRAPGDDPAAGAGRRTRIVKRRSYLVARSGFARYASRITKDDSHVATRDIKKIKQIPREEHVLPGTALCAGCEDWRHCGWLQRCWETTSLRECRRVFYHARGLSFHAVQGLVAVHHDGVGSAGAQGCARCSRCPDRQRPVAERRGSESRGAGGDGSTYDMALSSTSGAIYRGLDFYYFCYDNEAYGNTGMQLSAATPYGARTATSPCSLQHPSGAIQEKKDIFEIWRAHKPPYIATVAPRYPLDLEEKFARASKFTGRSCSSRSPPVPPAGCTIREKLPKWLNWR